jgi:hypothetical protein
MGRNNREYQICRDLALYMKLQYPKVLYHFDLTGLNLSIAQAGMSKAIQRGKGWPDLFIAEPRGIFHGMFIEIKAEDTKLYNKATLPRTPHLQEQENCLFALEDNEYVAKFGVGFDECKFLIDEYLNQ